MEHFGAYLSALLTSGAAWLASAGFVVGDFLLKHAAPRFHANWARGELGRVVLVVLVSGGLVAAGYSAWRAPYEELKAIKAANDKLAQPPVADPPSSASTRRQAAVSPPVAQPETVAPAPPARPTDAQVNADISTLLFKASLIEAEAGSFRGDYDQAAIATRITRWQTEAAVFLRNNIGPEAEKDFRSVAPVAPNSQVGALLNGTATTTVGMFTAQREVLKAYSR